MSKRSPWCRRAIALGRMPSTNVEQMRSRHSRAMGWGDFIVSLFSHAVVFTIGLIGFSFLLMIFGVSKSMAFATLSLIYIYLAAFCGTFILGIVLKKIGKRNIKMVLISRRCHVCVHCFYDLTARPAGDDICPECGSYTPRRECVRLWCKLLRSRV